MSFRKILKALLHSLTVFQVVCKRKAHVKKVPLKTLHYTLQNTINENEICSKKNIRVAVLGSTGATGQYSEYLKMCNGVKIAYENIKADQMTECLEEFLGPQIFDVFVLMDFYPTARKGLDGLALHIKGRFRDAKIILIQDFFPSWAGYESRSRWMRVTQWARSNGHEQMTEADLDAFDAAAHTWGITDFAAQDHDFYHALDATGGYILHKGDNAYWQSLELDYAKTMILNNAKLYSEWDKYSELGATSVKKQILGIIKNDPYFTRSDVITSWPSLNRTGLVCSEFLIS